VSSLKTVFAN